MQAPTSYELLGVSPTASAEDIGRAYRKLIRQFHPDIVGDAGLQMTLRINEAWHDLGDPARRVAYDRTLRDQQEPWTEQPEPEPEPRPRQREREDTPPRQAPRTDPSSGRQREQPQDEEEAPAPGRRPLRNTMRQSWSILWAWKPFRGWFIGWTLSHLIFLVSMGLILDGTLYTPPPTSPWVFAPLLCVFAAFRARGRGWRPYSWILLLGSVAAVVCTGLPASWTQFLLGVLPVIQLVGICGLPLGVLGLRLTAPNVWAYWREARTHTQ